MKKILVLLMTILSLTFSAQNIIPQDCENKLNYEPNNLAAKTTQVLASCPATNNLFTFYAFNNAQRGIMFDLQAINPVTIQCFDVNLDPGTTNVAIYTKAGTHVGFESTPGAWILVGTAINVVAAGANLPTYVPVIVNIPIGAGLKQAFYITRTTVGGPVVDYTNGILVGNLLAADANLRIFDGTGKELLFSTNFSPRQFNGRIYYNTGILPIELISFNGNYTNNNNSLQWITATETNNAYFSIERSENAVDWSEIAKIDGSGNSYQTKKYSFNDSDFKNVLNYYRLKQVDYDGNYKEASIIVIDNKKDAPVVVKTMNVMGQEVASDFDGLKFVYYSNGTVKKKIGN